MCALCDYLNGDDNTKTPPPFPGESPSPVPVPAPRLPIDASLPEQPQEPDFDAMIQKAVDELLDGLFTASPEPEPAPKPGFMQFELPKDQEPPQPLPTDASDQAAMIRMLELGTEMFGMPSMLSMVSLMLQAGPDDEVVLDVRLRKRGEADPTPWNPTAELRRWHEAVGQKRLIELDEYECRNVINLRRSLHVEEANEVDDELYELAYYPHDGESSRATLAKELADDLVIAFGTADLFEIDLPAVFNAVMRKNWEKIDPITKKPYSIRDDGKVLKPEGFVDLTVEEINEIIG